MKKKLCMSAVIASAVLLMGQEKALALSQETEMLLNLLQAKGVISQQDAQSFKSTIETQMAGEAEPETSHRHSVQSLADRLDTLEKSPSVRGERILDKVKVSGFVEVEASTSRADNGAGVKTKASDINLATAELDFDMAVNPYVNGHLALQYKEGETNSTFFLDEGIVALKAGEDSPFSMKVGKMYVPFGHFESHFITDPLTLTLGETNDTALVFGYSNPLLEMNVGAFNGVIHEAGNSQHINSYVGSAVVTLPENAIPGLSANAGVSYLSNLATSDELQTKVTDTTNHTVNDRAAGYSAFGHFEFQERYTLDLEYLGALDDFADGDLSFIDANNRRPAAWNMEVAAFVSPKLEFALRYGGSEETASAYAEDMYGAALLYEVLENTSLSLEYLAQEFRDTSDSQTATMQLAVEF